MITIILHFHDIFQKVLTIKIKKDKIKHNVARDFCFLLCGILKEAREKSMFENLFGRINEKLNKSIKLKNAGTLAAVTHTHTHTHCLLVNNFCAFFNAVKLKLNRVFKGSTTRLPIWQGGAGLSFVALFESVMGMVVSGLKVRYGPFVRVMNDRVYKNYERSCIV